MDDHLLLTRFVTGGSEEAFRQITARYWKQVYACCFRRLARDHASAEEATQAVFIALLTKATMFTTEKKRPVLPWLLTAAKYVVLNMIRDEKTRKQYESGNGLSPKQAGPDWSVMSQNIDEMVDGLSDNVRTAVMLHYSAGWSVTEIAERLSVTEYKARKWISTGLEKIKNKLVKSNVDIRTSVLSTLMLEKMAEIPGTSLSEPVFQTILTAQTAGAATPAAHLAQGAMKMMFISKVKKISAAALVALTIGGVCSFAGDVGASKADAAGDNGERGTVTAPALDQSGVLVETTARKPAEPIRTIETNRAEEPAPPSLPIHLADEKVAKPGVAAGPAEPEPFSDDAKAAVAGNTAFACDLYAKLKDEPGNFAFSPYSISVALGMTYAGARGQTAEEMAKVMRFMLPQEKLHPAFGSIIDSFTRRRIEDNVACELEICNALWPAVGVEFLAEFVDINTRHYSAGVFALDYKTVPDACVREINGWIEEKTRGRIKGIVESLEANTKLVLTNAVYFRGQWARKFNPTLTVNAPFHAPTGNVEAPMMCQTGNFQYAETDQLQILEMPYVGEKLSMVVLLPTETDGISKLEASLTAENLAAWRSSLRSAKVRVELPRFKIDPPAARDLAGDFKKMGMQAAFGDADFSGMTGRRDLVIRNILHKTFVEIDEDGTEAAAATAVVMHIRALPTFKADRPFIFIIRDNETQSLLFIGRISDPTKS